MNENLHTYIDPELEARITALVLGETSEFESDELEKLIQGKPELAIFRRRIQAMHDLLGETIKPERDENWQLSPDRRANLKKTFSRTQPITHQRSSRRPDRHQWRAAISIAACLLVCVVLFALVTPVYKEAKMEVASAPEIISYSAASEGENDASFTTRSSRLQDERKSESIEGQVPELENLPTTGKLFKKQSESTRGVTRKPSVPSSSMSRVIASGVTSVTAVPVPEVDIPMPPQDFGDGDDFGDGWDGKKINDDSVVAQNQTRTDGKSSLSQRQTGKGSSNISGGGHEVAESLAYSPSDPFAAPDEKPKVKRKYIYPSEYEPPEHPNSVATGGVAEAVFPKTPATPADHNSAAIGDARYKKDVAKKDTSVSRSSKPVAKPTPAARPVINGNGKLASISKELQKKSDDLAERRKKLMDVAERVGVIWVETEKGGESIGGQLELRNLAEHGLVDANKEKEQLAFHLNKLLTLDDDELVAVAADLPDVGFKENYNQYVQAKRDLQVKMAQGLAKGHPDIIAREKAITELKSSLKKRAVNVRESLKYKLKLVESRVGKMREVLNEQADRGTDKARSFQEFNQLRKDYEAAQAAKDQLEVQYDIAKFKQKTSPANLKVREAQDRVTRREIGILPPAAPKALPDETQTRAQPFSTFSLNVSDVSFKLAKAALLEKGQWPNASKVRTEEFVNAFNYGDPSPRRGEPVACAIEQSAHPFLQQRNLLRIGMKTASSGRSTPLRLTVLLDNSGSMEREDREASVIAAMEVLAAQLGPQDVITLVGFASKPRLLADRVSGDKAAKLVNIVAKTPSEGGTNLEEALRLARTLALRQRAKGAQDRVVLITDGVANLGNTVPEQLAREIETMRQNGIAFDACGVGAEGLNDDILESLTRKGDGRYYFLNRAEDADAGFAKQLAGALTPAAKNVKVQVKFNPNRVSRYRLLGFEKHRLKKKDFRNDKVDAAEMAAEEAGNAVYQIQVNPNGSGELGEVFVRFLDTNTNRMVERSWPLPYEPQAKAFDQTTPSMQLAGTAAMLGEKLHGTDAGSVRFSMIAQTLGKLRAHYAADPKVQDLIRMCRKVK